MIHLVYKAKGHLLTLVSFSRVSFSCDKKLKIDICSHQRDPLNWSEAAFLGCNRFESSGSKWKAIAISAIATSTRRLRRCLVPRVWGSFWAYNSSFRNIYYSHRECYALCSSNVLTNISFPFLGLLCSVYAIAVVLSSMVFLLFACVASRLRRQPGRITITLKFFHNMSHQALGKSNIYTQTIKFLGMIWKKYLLVLTLGEKPS